MERRGFLKTIFGSVTASLLPFKWENPRIVRDSKGVVQESLKKVSDLPEIEIKINGKPYTSCIKSMELKTENNFIDFTSLEDYPIKRYVPTCPSALLIIECFELTPIDFPGECNISLYVRKEDACFEFNAVVVNSTISCMQSEIITQVLTFQILSPITMIPVSE